MDTLPFFYYDILARIIPGAATLAVLWNIKSFPPITWLVVLGTSADTDWKKIIVPVVLLGVCYLIGVIYEVLDYFPDLSMRGKLPKWFMGMKLFSQWIDDRAFDWALCRACTLDQEIDSRFGSLCVDLNIKKDERYARRNEMWDELTYAGGSKPELAPVFAHCHRFQAEQKMFLHLIYPTIMFLAINGYKAIAGGRWIPHSGGLYGFASLLLFIACCRSRSRRRWLQTISFWNLMQKQPTTV